MIPTDGKPDPRLTYPRGSIRIQSPGARSSAVPGSRSADLVAHCRRRAGSRRIAESPRWQNTQAAAAQILSLVQIKGFRSRHAELATFNGLELASSSYPLATDLARAAAAAVVCELLLTFCPAGEPAPRRFRLGVSLLEGLLAGVEPATGIAYAQFWILMLAGVLPDLDETHLDSNGRRWLRGCRARPVGEISSPPPRRTAQWLDRRTRDESERQLRALDFYRKAEGTTEWEQSQSTDTDGVAGIEFRSPVLATHVLGDFSADLERLAVEVPRKPVVVTSSHPKIFLAGADLGEISMLDAETCMEYARLGRGVLETIRRHPSPVIAAVDGSCSGGGFDLVLACDLIVAGPAATFSHPGVIRGLVTGWSGTVHVPQILGRSNSRGALLEGRPVSAGELHDAGGVHLVMNDVHRAASDTARRMAALHTDRLGLWRACSGSKTRACFRAWLSQGIIE